MRRTAVVVMCLIGSMLVWASPSQGFPNASDEPVHASFTLEACRLTVGTTLPINGKFICPDAMYTTGNLGKSWNELDLVPHRLTSTLGSQSDAKTTYKVSVAADGITSGKVGYDVLSAAVVNAAKSDASCTVSAGATATAGTAAQPFGGGTDTVIYRDLTIHQNKNTICVVDWYQRLALTSHLYPGSSLQSYMFPGANLSGSKKTLSIPVNQIAPQTLQKDMTASQTQGFVWDIAKTPTPSTVDFTNSCLPANRTSANVQIGVTWHRVTGAPSAITLVTHVYATNPSARAIQTTVTDHIYTGSTHTTEVTPTESSGSPTHLTNTVTVPAFTTMKVIDFVGTVPAGTATSFNDEAIGTYVDDVTGVAITQTTSAVAGPVNVTVSPGGNATATITDTESISSGFHFKVTSTSGASGTFGGGYTLNTSTTGPVTWTSGTQTGDGSVTFNKTITADAASVVTLADNKALTDTATVTGSSGFTASAPATVTLTSSATLSVGVNKNMQGGVSGTQTFVFDVYAASNADESVTGLTKLDTITISITPPDTNGSGSITTPATSNSNTFTIRERPATNWAVQPNQVVTVNLPSCSSTSTFNNTFGPATAKVQKVTVPAGSEAGWEFTLDGPGTPSGGEKATTTGSGYVNFTTPLEQGDYTITETAKTGFDFTSTSGDCSFSVTYPDDADRSFACTYTNTARGSLEVTKTVDWNGVTPDTAQTFAICITGPSFPVTPDCKNADYDGSTLTWTNLLQGVYTVSETDPGSSWTVSGGDGATATVNPGLKTTASGITNTRKLGSLQVTKSVDWNGITSDINQTFAICITGPSFPVTPDCKNADWDGGTLTWSNLIPGDYTATESDPGNTWTVAGSPTGTITVPADGTTASVVPVITNTKKLGSLQVTKTVDWNGVTPVSGTTFDICIQGPTYPVTPDCKTATYPNDLVVTWTGLVPGSYTITESGLGSSWTKTGDTSATVPTDGGQATAGVTNTRKLGSLKVTKTVDWSGTTPNQAKTFQICITGPTYPSGDCTTIDYDGGTYTWTDLIPGDYVVSETAPGSEWTVTVTGSPATVPTDGGQATAGVTNKLNPPTGTPRTIGYWKNWASCSPDGNQAPILDRTLAAAEPNGIVVSATSGTYPAFGATFWLVLHGDTSSPDAAPDCLKAITLLDKRSLGNGNDKSADPAFNLAAQLIGAELNYAANSPKSTTVTDAITDAVRILGKYHFDGYGYQGKINKGDAKTMVALATTLDKYNNSGV